MVNEYFQRVVMWLNTEREEYQTKKFNYEGEDKTQTVEEWTRQFDNYIGRLSIFGLDTMQGKQAALKLAATAVALCEHLAESGTLPKPGVSSGIIEEWNN